MKYFIAIFGVLALASYIEVSRSRITQSDVNLIHNTLYEISVKHAEVIEFTKSYDSFLLSKNYNSLNDCKREIYCDMLNKNSKLKCLANRLLISNDSLLKYVIREYE